ncbi:hypothetical protein M885DRAFT_539411 [Pelagophyceae sp. CCMP2097]|nr:hypothetical protein M885DRAFT_539411 [Pelagophyceae sp. CCMP2097]
MGIGLELQEVVTLDGGITIEKMMCNGADGGRAIDQVIMPDRSPENMQRVVDRLQTEAAETHAKLWASREAREALRPDEPMWTYDIAEAGLDAVNGTYVRRAGRARNGAPVYFFGSFMLSREFLSKSEDETDTKTFGWILGSASTKAAHYGVVTDSLSVPLDGWMLLSDDAASPAPYATWARVTDAAVRHKTAGNVCFKRGEWASASAEYLAGAALAPVDAAVRATLLSNRAECQLRLSDWFGALSSAEDAIEAAAGAHDVLEKAQGRRARAARELGQFNAAASAYAAAVDAAHQRKNKTGESCAGGDAAANADALREVRALARVEALLGGAVGAGPEDAQLLECERAFDALRSLRSRAVDEDDAAAAQKAAVHLGVLEGALGTAGPCRVAQHYVRAVGGLSVLAAYVDAAPNASPHVCALAVLRIGAACAGDDASLLKCCALMPQLQSALLSDDMRCAVSTPALILDLIKNARCGKRATLAFMKAPGAQAAFEALLRISTSTPKVLAYRLETARFTRQEWAAAQSDCANVCARLAEAAPLKMARLLNVDLAVRMLASADAVGAFAARILRAATAGGDKAVDARLVLDISGGLAGLLSFTRDALASTGELARYKPDGAQEQEADVVYYFADQLDAAKLDRVVTALTMLADEAEFVASGRGVAAQRFNAVKKVLAGAWRFFAPLLHAPPDVAEPAVRLLAAACLIAPATSVALAELGLCRPLLTLDAPSRQESISSSVASMLEASPRARAACAAVLASACAHRAFQQTVEEDVQRCVQLLCRLVERTVEDRSGADGVESAARALRHVLSYRPRRVDDVDLGFIENVLVPAWRACAPQSQAKASLSKLLRLILADAAFLERLTAKLEQRGRLGLVDGLVNELRLEDLGDSASRFQDECNDLSMRWTVKAKAEQLRNGSADVELKRIAKHLAHALQPDTRVLEMGFKAGVVSLELAKLGSSVVVADACAAARTAVQDAALALSTRIAVVSAVDDVFGAEAGAATVERSAAADGVETPGGVDIVLLVDAQQDVDDWEQWFASVRRNLEPRFLCFVEDKDAGYVMCDDARHAGFVEDDASRKLVVLQNGRDLFIFRSGPGAFPTAAAPLQPAAAPFDAGALRTRQILDCKPLFALD